MPIIHVRISYNSVTLKDWEGLPVEKETKLKDFFNDIPISYLSSNFWGADFEVKFSSSITLAREKVSPNCIAWGAMCQYGILRKFLSGIARKSDTYYPIEIPYYSSGLFKEARCFNREVECEEENNYGEYFPYCEDCSASVENKKRRSKENKFVQVK
ncbi:unnamed protein product [Rhizophagus irregularis]|uniref:Uncharacterized protein n=1 Tax=Rhizophagus irregularis TaxID=588596 RepID=A0A2N1MQB1_9GLOM|nr:hypothetical protein RhiirC2_788366 [Rhizophagus irregularis]CAB4390524.1 unnamed protein product [Rhizophagus irregularis]CAB5370762.1 unnamed protein product [Rhizophagus irregularis]